jgi:hypothetical protein
MNADCLGASAASLDTLPPIGSAVAHCIEEVESLAAAGEPVVLKGTIDHWPALQAANQSPAALDEYLKARDSGAPVPVMEAPAATRGCFGYAADLREFSFTKRNRPLAETLDRIARTRTQQLAGYIAIQLLPLDERLPGFVRDNPMPIVSPSARPNLWLGGPVKTQIHNDRDHNLACVLAGHRRFVLFPPEQVTNLYIGPLDNPPPLSLVDPESPDLARFPRFAEALKSARVAHLGPGDALLMPRYWWHHVTSRDPYNAMVNYWWGDRTPGLGNAHDAFLTALLALKTLPASERAYWRAMFEAYVFSDDGAAHLPAPSRGLLGPMTSSLRATLKRRLRDTVLKS